MPSGWETTRREVCAVEEETYHRSAEGITALHDGMSIFVAGVDLAKPQDDEPARMLQMGFISQSFNTLFLAIRAASMGLHFQAIGLMRPDI